MGIHADDLMDWSDVYEFTHTTRRSKPTFIKIIHYGIIHETSKAWKIALGKDRDEWFPKKCCKLTKDYISVPEWLVKEKNV